MHTPIPATFAVAALLTASLAIADDKSGNEDNRRYEGVAASATAVWIVDTRTGKVRKCTQEFADQRPSCSQMSN
ncbi:MAG: hypothetical protein H6959_08005 [Chromatiaceae bacterium]|nr:hypothetical protein [Gammaproteobacteria bacterium]MCP5300777.1 hypothetical protein [Chromatiaceae bacterium]MCP5422849.1 hypothetical protein [Chromatiaceae bacterium]